MQAEVKSSDFTDQQIDRFFDAVTHVQVEVLEDVPPWLHETAQELAAQLPRPTPNELRLHIDHAVAVARGWDEPYDRKTMFDTAVKSFYILQWFERAHDRAMEIEGELDTRQIMDVTLSPRFGHGRPEV